MLSGPEMKRRMSPWGSSFASGRSSDSAAMASEPPDVMTNQEPAEVQEECSGKKKSKFQTFKKFFARKKRKDPSAAGADGGLKASQSSDNVSKASENNTLTRSEKEKGSGSKISLGSKALSHDSVFVSDSSEANDALGASQDSIHGKVKSLQLQLKQAIRLGSPPSLMCVKRTEDAGTMSEDDGLPCSPPEYTTHTVMNQAQRDSSISLEGMDSDDDQLSCAASSRAVSPLVVPGDFSQPASPFGCLDNSAAKHKLGLRHKACNRRKPARRPEGRAEGGSVVEEMLTASLPETEAEAMEEQKQLRTEDVSGDQLKPKAESKEEEEEEEQPQHSIQSLLRDKEQREEQEDESEAEQDVSHGPDASCPPEPSLSEEEEGSDTEPLPSSKHDSTASSPDSPSSTPEPPAGPREYLLDPPGISYGAEENKVDSDLASGGEEEDEAQEKKEEESSFLQEVLSSLKTPLVSHSLDVEAEGIVLEMKEEVEEKEDVEDGEEVKEEEVNDQAVPSCAILSGQTAAEEEEEVTSSWKVEEELKVNDEEEEDKAEEDDDEDLVVERFIQESPDEEEQAEDVKPVEGQDSYTRLTVSQTGEEEEEEEESEGEAIQLGKEPEVEEEGQEKMEEEDDGVEEVNEDRGMEEAVEAMEEEKSRADEVTEMFPYVQNDMSLQEADEDVALETDPTKHMDDDGIPAEMEDQVMQEGQERSGDEEEEEEEEAEEQKSDQEEDTQVNQTNTDQTEEELNQESVTVTQVDMDPSEATEQAVVSPKPSSLSLFESPPESHPQHSEANTPTKTSTTSIHINLVSPSSEKATSVFQLPPTAADPRDSVSESPSPDVEPHTASTHEEQADSVEEKTSTQEQEAATPSSVEETVSQPPSTVDQSKTRFTIAPAWQRSQSLTPPSSPPACASSSSEPRGEEVEAATKKDPVMKAEPGSPAKVELVLSPSRMRNITAKPQTNAAPPPVKPQTTAEESSVVVEGNPDNPFGVRLRKTSALFRFNSEEENTELSVESVSQPTSCKADSPQPVSVKPSVCPPVSIKPALPKKPEAHGDSGGKPKWTSDPAAGRGASVGSDCPSWISVAKQKQKIYKENSLDDITVKKEEQERKSSQSMYVSSAANRELSSKTAEPSSKVSHLEITKPSASAEKEVRRSLSPPTPVPPQPSKSQPPPCPVAPKPQVPPAVAKHTPQPTPPQRSLSPPTPVPVSQKSPSCTSPPSPSKTATSPTVTSPPFSSRAAPEKSAQRGVPPPALPQDEPPWMALAKKKAKAWSEMPQIVQ